LELDEFRALVTRLRDFQLNKRPTAPPDDIERVFRQFDVDVSGDIDVDELTTALNALGVRSDGSQAELIMGRYRSANSAGLRLPEFRRLVTELRQFLGSPAWPTSS